jgi:hypothetical protein
MQIRASTFLREPDPVILQCIVVRKAEAYTRDERIRLNSIFLNATTVELARFIACRCCAFASVALRLQADDANLFRFFEISG